MTIAGEALTTGGSEKTGLLRLAGRALAQVGFSRNTTPETEKKTETVISYYLKAGKDFAKVTETTFFEQTQIGIDPSPFPGTGSLVVISEPIPEGFRHILIQNRTTNDGSGLETTLVARTANETIKDGEPVFTELESHARPLSEVFPRGQYTKVPAGTIHTVLSPTEVPILDQHIQDATLGRQAHLSHLLQVMQTPSANAA